MRSFCFRTQVLTSTHEGKAHDYDFDHDGLVDEDTEKHGDLGPLIDRANPLYSSPAPSVDIDANIIPLTSAWTALADATCDWDVEGLSARYRPSSPVWRYRKRIPCLCSSRMRRRLRSVRMGRFSKWFHVWVSGLLGADACCCSVMNFLGHGYVKEKTREMEDHNYESEEEESSDEGDSSVDRSFILGA